ncbi:MAG: hypothetical protein H8E37_03590 [Planctomycetes bacterium]|nr:hypothetical protein [Planctomycetota bacterium]
MAESLVPGCDLPLRDQILGECEVMLRHALGNGIPVPPHIAKTLEVHLSETLASSDSTPNEQSDIAELTRIHHRLSRMVAPAIPRALLLLAHERQQGGPLRFLGPLPLIRQVWIAALLSLIALCWIGTSPHVTGRANEADILKSSGVPLLLNELFYLSAAGLGASFSTLFRANRYVVEGTYDPKYDTLYWSRFLLGIIAGLILVEFVPLDTSGHVTSFARPLLAILGGFSSTVVYQILSRLVESVGSVVQGDVATIKQVERASADMRREVSESQHRMEVVGQMLDLQSRIHAGLSAEETLQAVHGVTQKLIGSNEFAETAEIEPGDDADHEAPSEADAEEAS